MSTYDWLLLFHMAGAFAVVTALVLLSAALIVAVRRDRPSEVALVLGLARPARMLFNVGGLVILVFGLWLVVHLDAYEITDGWILAALALWLVTAGAGERAANAYRDAGRAASRLAGEGDTATPESAALVRSRRGAVLHALSAAAVLATLVLMIFKPGAG